ncbi:MAG TPA: PIN domain-containing protein, partial [Candidatus Sphingobacterium stercorigallinarum]|nr:PIN domain-containing protein [Candidatus Sphingobacterium stercorigallinarum]
KYKLIKEELENYSDKFEIKELQEVSYDLITQFPPDQLDFNDNYIYQFAKQHNATLITDDGDYRNLDLKLATYNKKLYTAYKDNIKPTSK